MRSPLRFKRYFLQEIGNVLRHCGNDLQPQNGLPWFAPFLAVRCCIPLPHEGQDGPVRAIAAAASAFRGDAASNTFALESLTKVIKFPWSINSMLRPWANVAASSVTCPDVTKNARAPPCAPITP